MRGRKCAAILLAAVAVLVPAHVRGEPVPVRHAEGLVHGFLVLRTTDGVLLGNGDLIQTTRGDQVTSRLILRFKDGSIHDETAVYSQRRVFRLISDHLVGLQTEVVAHTPGVGRRARRSGARST